MKSYIFLFIAILSETLATSTLKLSEQFTKPLPSVLTVVGYLVTFYFLSLSLRTLPIGIAYGIWAAAGIVLVTLIGAIFFHQTPDAAAYIGLTLIVTGVLTIHLFSKMSVH